MKFITIIIFKILALLKFQALLITIVIFITPAYAAESTPSADIKSKLEELKKEIASKAAVLKAEVNRKLQDKAYVGTIEGKTQNSATLATRNGAKIVSINQDSVFESKIKTRKSLTLKTLSTKDYIAALGDIDETGVLTAKKIILLPEKKLPAKTYLWGQVISISDKLITLKDRDLKTHAVSLSSLKTSPNLKKNDFVIAVGSFTKNDIFEASFVHVLP